MKKLAQTFNLFLNEAGVSASLFFVMFELIGINTYSIHYVLQTQHQTMFNYLPAVIGAIAYSITTIVVMQQQGHKQLKTILPVLDGFLVFLGMNLMFIEQYQNDSVNYVAVTLSLLFATFTAVITYSLGQINSEKSEDMIPVSELKSVSQELDLTKQDINASLSEIEQLKSELILKTHEYDDAERMYEGISFENKRLKEELKSYKAYYIEKEKFRIQRKKPHNRTKEELSILNQ